MFVQIETWIWYCIMVKIMVLVGPKHSKTRSKKVGGATNSEIIFIKKLRENNQVLVVNSGELVTEKLKKRTVIPPFLELILIQIETSIKRKSVLQFDSS